MFKPNSGLNIRINLYDWFDYEKNLNIFYAWQ